MIGYDKYARTDIETSDPRAVIVLLYEGCVRFLNESLSACRAGRRMDVSTNINRTLKIIQFLSTALNFDLGGEVAANLSRLYVYLRDLLLQSNLTCDAAKIEEAQGLFKVLLEGWREVAHDPEAAAVLESRSPVAVRARSAGANASSDAIDAQEETDPPVGSSASLASPYREAAGVDPSPSPALASPLAPGVRIAAQHAYGIRQVG